MTKKTNPRKIPRTQADVDKAFQFGTYMGSETALIILVHTVCDMGADDDFVETMWEKYKYNVDSMHKGYMKLGDVRKTLESERNIKFDDLRKMYNVKGKL